MPRRRRIKVVYKKLGRAKAWGLADETNRVVEIDERLRGKKHLEILTHEVIHLLLPHASEEEVEHISINLINILWKEGYRRFDGHDKDPMQDGRV